MMVSCDPQLQVCWCWMRHIETTDWESEVDDAVKAHGQDPTGGRGGTNLNMNSQLAATQDEEMLQSAI